VLLIYTVPVFSKQFSSLFKNGVHIHASKIDCLGVVTFSLLLATVDTLSALMLFQNEKSGTPLV
jgi:hypothetical protein